MKNKNAPIITLSNQLMKTPSHQRDITKTLFWHGYARSLLKKGQAVEQKTLITIINCVINYALNKQFLDWKFIDNLSKMLKSGSARNKFFDKITALLKPKVRKKFGFHFFHIYHKDHYDPLCAVKMIMGQQTPTLDVLNGKTAESGIQIELTFNPLLSQKKHKENNPLIADIIKIYQINKKTITIQKTLYFDKNLQLKKEQYSSNNSSYQDHQLEIFFKEKKDIEDFSETVISYSLPILFTCSEHINKGLTNLHTKTKILTTYWNQSNKKISKHFKIPLSINNKKQDTIPTNYFNIANNILDNKKRSDKINLNNIKSDINKTLEQEHLPKIHNRLTALLVKSVLVKQGVTDIKRNPIIVSIKQDNQYFKISMLIFRHPLQHTKKLKIRRMLRNDIIQVNCSKSVGLKWVKARKTNQKGMLFQIIIPTTIVNHLKQLADLAIHQLTTKQPQWFLSKVKKPLLKEKVNKITKIFHSLFCYLVDKYHQEDQCKDLEVHLQKEKSLLIKVCLKFKDYIKCIFFTFNGESGISKSFYVLFFTPLLKNQHLETLYYGKIKKNMNPQMINCSMKREELTPLFHNEIYHQKIEVEKTAHILKSANNLHLDVMQNRP